MSKLNESMRNWLFSDILRDLQDLKAQHIQQLQVQEQNRDALEQRTLHILEHIEALAQQLQAQAQSSDMLEQNITRVFASIKQMESRVAKSEEDRDAQIARLEKRGEDLSNGLQKANRVLLDMGNLYAGEYVISVTRRFENNFFWVTKAQADDMITQYVRQGFSGPTIWDYVGEKIWNMLQEPGTFLDLGANIGAFCFPLAQAGWRGFAVEASQINADVLRKSIMLNGFDIQVCEKAVYERTGKVYFYQDGPQGYVQDSVHADKPYEEIDAIALDDYKKDPALKEIRSIDLIKMDIEGSEPFALRGMKKFLEEVGYPAIYTEVNVWNLFCMGESQYRYFEQLKNLGYTPFILKNGGLYQIAPDYFPEIPCTDYFFLPKDCNLRKHIRGSIEQNAQDILCLCKQLLTDMKAYLETGQREETPILPHISLYSYIEEYPLYAGDPDIRRLREAIAALLVGTERSAYRKMLGIQSI